MLSSSQQRNSKVDVLQIKIFQNSVCLAKCNSRPICVEGKEVIPFEYKILEEGRAYDGTSYLFIDDDEWEWEHFPYPYAAENKDESQDEIIRRTIVLPLFTTIYLPLVTLYPPAHFIIISSTSSSTNLLMYESLLVLKDCPTTDSQTSSVQLTLF